MNYGDMIRRIAVEVSRPDLAPNIPLAIQSAIQYYQSTDFWFNEARETASTVRGQAYMGWPSDYIDVDSLLITANGNKYPLRPVTWAELEAKDSGLVTGVPSEFATFGQQFRLYPTPNAVYTITWSGTKTLSALVNADDSNAWTNEAEELIRNRAKAVLLESDPNSALASRFNDRERQALTHLLSDTERRVATGRLRSWW